MSHKMKEAMFGKVVGKAKALGEGVDISDDDLALINRFALTPIEKDQVYAREYIVAHSGIDRDKERFPEEVLGDFSRTIPGKGYFNNVSGHPGSSSGQRGPGQGLWFKAVPEEMPLDSFEAKTGERPPLAAGKTNITALRAWFYTVKTPENEEMRRMIDAGVHRHVSIGFGAKSLISIKDPADPEKTLYWEYVGPGEAFEASAVYLGAQPGAVSQKCAGCTHKQDKDETPTKGASMPKMVEELEQELSNTKARVKELETLKTAIGGTGDLKAVEDLHAKVKELTPLAADGKAYREAQVKEYIRLGRLAGKLPDDPEKLKEKEDFVAGWPMKHLQDELAGLREQVRKTHPDQAELPAEDANARRTDKTPGATDTKSLENPAKNDWLI